MPKSDQILIQIINFLENYDVMTEISAGNSTQRQRMPFGPTYTPESLMKSFYPGAQHEKNIFGCALN